MASAADMNHALRNTMIELQRYALVLLLCFSCLPAGADSQELLEEDTNCDINTSNWPTGAPVTALSLDSARIVGVLPSEVFKLSSLQVISLTFSEGLSGPIPKEIMQLQNLTYLNIEGDMFIGNFPFNSIMEGSKLLELNIGSNHFNGPIENDAFRNLGQLRSLSLSGNNFTGKVPDISPMQHNLESLDLSSNNFTGQAPDVAKFNLKSLDLSSNGFTGQAPNVSEMTQLIDLDLSSNGFTGQAPNVSEMTQLTYLNLSSNGFTGQAPNVSEMTRLTYLDLSSNGFTGQAPNVSEMTQLTYLKLSSNGFTGQAPNVSEMTRLTYLNMSKNKFEGQAPDVSNLSGLNYLDFSQNKFRGNIPVVYSDSLDYLDLSQNEFTGEAPVVSNFSRLRTLNLSSNNFTELPNGLSLFLSKLPWNLALLDLSSLLLGGPAPNWTNISVPLSLSELYLDKNNLTGTLNISAFLESGNSKSLKVLSLEDNMITGVISPDSEVINYEMGLTNITLWGNPYCNRTWTSQHETKTCNFYCKSTSCVYKPPKMDRKISVMASSISSSVILLVVLGFGFVLRRKEKYIRDLQKKIKEADVNAKRFDYNVLRDATKNFAPEMKLGEGAYGAVYKGILAGNIVVAVKQLLLNTNASREDFVNEILLISNLQHRNLVALKGYCLKDRQTLLVYEYVDNCDLDKSLLSRYANVRGSTSDGLQLWKTRLKICQGVAQGLYYLHTSSQSRILHRDIKASNILLDKNFEAKIADFGLARLIAGSVTMTGCAGTIGYLAPEYASAGHLSDKTDVYSFGVLVLEIVSGMRNRDQRMPEDELHLTTWARKLYKTNRLLDMRDPTLIVSEDEAEEVQRVLETAVLCVQNDPKKRPSMILVAAMLAGKASGDALPPIDEDLDVFSAEFPSEQSDCDLNPLFVSSAPVSLANKPACNPQIELSSSQVKLWRTG